MTTLTVSLFGSFQASIGQRPLTQFRTRKVKALFIYLVVENKSTRGMVHQREALMELLWPGLPLKSAQANLRQTLYQLRKSIPEATANDNQTLVPFLLSDHNTVEFNPNYPLHLDVATFAQLVSEGNGRPDKLAAAAALIRGDFLADFYLPDSETFEAWAANRRADFQRQALDLLDTVTQHYLNIRQYKKAQQTAWQQLTLDNLHERAYCQLMIALAKTGQRNAALAQYQQCRQKLAEELGVEPTAQTTDLFQQIQADALRETQLQQPPPTLSRLSTDAWLIFFFSDIEGSTRLWDEYREKMLPVLKRHYDILQHVITQHEGRILQDHGDGILAVFAGVNPLACVLAIQQQFAQESWGEIGELRIRIGLHGVPVDSRGHDYFYDDGVYYGSVLNYASRIADAGHGGQIVASTAVKENYDLPPAAHWQDLGQHTLKSLDEPQHIFGLLHPDLPHQDFPPLRTSAQKEYKVSSASHEKRFVREELIAIGGHGKLYRGRDTETGKPVVIKQLKPEVVAQQPDLMDRFMREGKALRQLNHPNIVKMIAAQEQDGEYIIVMEYVLGGNLREWMEHEGQLPVAQILNIALELADALTRTHHLGIIHRDLKPSNVLLAEDSTPRLTDFGIAYMRKQDLRLTQDGSVLGSPAYMSPEACQGEELDARSDIWSFGILLYEMLTGQLPFAGENIVTVLIAIVNDPMPNLDQFRADNPPQLVALIEKMLAKDPAQRIGSVRQVAAELEQIQTRLLVKEAGADEKLERPQPPAPALQIAQSNLAQEQAQFFAYNLPTQPTAFIGREDELATLDNLLSDANKRLITIVGSGGMGKTRLALAMGQQQLTHKQTNAHPRFARGIFFVPLAPLSDPEAMVSTMALALHFQLQDDEQRSAKQQILDFLREKSLLLILDNFEHLLDGVGLVSEILDAAPNVKIVVTSRERLRLRAEHVYAIEGLEFPDWETPEDALGYTAVQLFLQSARRNQPDFDLTEGDDLTYLARICRLVAGMPLAIELAAAWVDMLSLKDIAEEIAQNLDLLETELHDVPDRHRSIRAAVDNSWQRLTPAEQTIFVGLSVFRGGFTRRAGQEVTGTTLRQLTHLANKSFLSYDKKRDRYQIHELLRQYGGEKLAQDAQVETDTRDQHCQYYLHALAEREEDLKGKRQKEALDEIEADFENVKVAWSWAVQKEHITLLNQALFCLTLFCERRSYLQESQMLIQETQLKLQTGIHTGERGLFWARILYREIPTRDERLVQLQKSEQLLNQLANEGLDIRQAKATVLFDLAMTTKNESLFKESLALYELLEDRWQQARVLESLSIHEVYWGRYDEGEQHLQQSLTLCRSLEDAHGIALVLRTLSISAFYQNHLDQAIQYSQESIIIFEHLGILGAKASVMAELSLYQVFHYQSLDEAEQRIQKCLQMGKELGDKLSITERMTFYAWSKLCRGHYPEAKRVAQKALLLARDIEDSTDIALNLVTLSDIALITGNDTSAESLIHEANQINRTLTRPVEINRSLLGLTWIQIGHQQYGDAEATVYDILAHYNINTCITLLPTAYLLAHRATSEVELEQALQLIGLYEQVVPLSQSPHFQTLAQRYLPTNLANLPAEQVEAAKAKGRTLDAKKVIAELYQTLPQMGWHTEHGD